MNLRRQSILNVKNCSLCQKKLQQKHKLNCNDNISSNINNSNSNSNDDGGGNQPKKNVLLFDLKIQICVYCQ